MSTPARALTSPISSSSPVGSPPHLPPLSSSSSSSSFKKKALNEVTNNPSGFGSSGAHTIGVSHCTSFSNRLYNFTGRGDQDPALDSNYAARLKQKCTSLADNVTLVEMDPGSVRTFDLGYYSLLLKRRGLFQSDAALTTNAAAKAFITNLVASPPQVFFQLFAGAMEKMGRIEVKTGSAGEIRRNCALVN